MYNKNKNNIRVVIFISQQLLNDCIQTNIAKDVLIYNHTLLLGDVFLKGYLSFLVFGTMKRNYTATHA